MLTFDEILKPFTIDEAVAEAKRCLNCKKPLCVQGCPIKNHIPEFIHEVANSNFEGAKHILDQTTNMPEICSRVCDHGKQCVGNCVLNRKGNPIDVGRLERFVADYNYENKVDEPHEHNVVTSLFASVSKGVSVAIIGAGPAGIACAKQLAKNNIRATIYEKESNIGGQLFYGIPQYRLNNEIIIREEEELQKLGVKVFLNETIGDDLTLDNLLEDYNYVVVTVGATEPKGLRIEGNDLEGVYQASEYLKQVSLNSVGQLNSDDLMVQENDTVLVIGGGNVAMDASRTAKRFTDDVHIVYRRWREVMPAGDFEYNESVEENVDYMWKRTPLEFVGENGKVTGMKVMNTNDDENNFEEIIPCTKVLIAIGSNLDNTVFTEFEEVKLNESWFIESENSKVVGFDNLYVAGDATLSPATVVEAVKTGIEVADKIIGSALGDGFVEKYKDINDLDENVLVDTITKLVANSNDLTDVLKKFE